MIPKTIHYCWFGPHEKPEIVQKCIASWKRTCPDYEIREWNETNYDIAGAPLYVRQAYEVKKWAFITDYARLDIVWRYGGVYLDTDVELLRPLDEFLRYDGFFAFDNKAFVATGLGFGSLPRSEILRELMDDYQTIPFLLDDGRYDRVPCPERNTRVFLRHGLKQEDRFQLLGNIAFFPSEYFSPLPYGDVVLRKTENTAAIHWYAATWQTSGAKKARERLLRRARLAERFRGKKALFTPLLGEQAVEKLYQRIKTPRKSEFKKSLKRAAKRLAFSLMGESVYARLRKIKNRIKYRD